jgi:hypothetical protein
MDMFLLGLLVGMLFSALTIVDVPEYLDKVEDYIIKLVPEGTSFIINVPRFVLVDATKTEKTFFLGLCLVAFNREWTWSYSAAW